MKNLIIIVGTLVLGCLIFQMIVGDSHSLKSYGRNAMEQTIERYESV